jgi:AraC-like DNA-binding protein
MFSILDLKTNQAVEPVVAWIVTIHLFVYLLSGLYFVLHKKNRSKLTWPKILLLSFALIWVSTIVIYLAGDTARTWDYFWLGASLFIYMVGYMAVARPEWMISIPRSRYERSSLTPSLAKLTIDKLNKYMEHEPYLESSLTLPLLAEKLHVPVHHLSQVINEHFGLNFNDYINKYRIQVAQRLLTDPSYNHQKLAAIAYKVGFNSLSVFNAAFKKHAGLTPTQYRDRNTF